MSSPAFEARALLTGAPHRGDALQQQLANLKCFYEDHRQQFDAMPYVAWTVPSKNRMSYRFAVRPASAPLRGLRGVFPVQAIPSNPNERLLMPYGGLLITEKLYEAFSKRYYCPTGLEIPALSYQDGDKEVKVLVIGDPTSQGAIINDGKVGRPDDSAVNCMLKSVRKELLHNATWKGRGKDEQGKLRVSSDVAGVWTLVDKPLQAQQELLLDYGSTFWSSQEPEHCLVCFSRLFSVDDPLILCSGYDGTDCSVARHRRCFSPPLPSSELAKGDLIRYFCPDHLALQKREPCNAAPAPSSVLVAATRPLEPAWSPVQNKAPPRAGSRTAASACPGPEWTPPPAAPRAVARPTSTAAAAAVAVQGAVAASASSASGPCHLEPEWSPPPRHSYTAAPESRSRSTAQRRIDLEPGPRPPASIFDLGSTSEVANNTDRFCISSSSSDADAMAWGAGRPSHACDRQALSVRRYAAAPYEDRRESSDFESSDISADDHDGSSDDSSDEESQSPRRRLANRSHASQSIGASSLPASVHEARHLLGPSGLARANRVKLHVRIPEQARLLEGYAQHVLLNDAQWGACLDLLAEQAKKKARMKQRHWCITQQDVRPFLPLNKKHKKDEMVNAAPLTRAESVMSNPDLQPMDIGDSDGDVASAAGASAPAQHASSVTTNRWRDRAELCHDYAEFRSCCGQPKIWIPQMQVTGLGGQAVEDHCSHTALAFFTARLKYRHSFGTKESMDNTVVRELKHGHPRWYNFDVCCSCFRAALGIGRSTLFTLVSRHESHDMPELTKSGAPRTQRKSAVRERVTDLLRSFCQVQGQSAPNPTGSDLRRRIYRLPQKQNKELRKALSIFEMEQLRQEEPVPISSSGLRRALVWLEKHEMLFVKLGTGGTLCRCSTCDKLDNQITPESQAENNLTPKDVMLIKAKKLMHLKQMQEQRTFFDQHKDKAVLTPLDEWCITLDGMDQAKTRLPSRTRYSKDLEPLDRLKLHWIGAFCFGGPEPVLGLVNTPELRKDAALSIVTLMTILDVQWRKLVHMHDLNARAAASKMEAASQASKEQAEIGEAAPEAAAYASTVSSSSASYTGPGMKWPRRLHLTFDNATGECKNQWMMRMLGLLVKHGVFEAITISMLLVGHTHDIVDQMFSVWSRILRIHNAETYEKMRDLFRERYHSRIEGLVQLMRGQREASMDSLGLSEEQHRAFEEQRGNGSDVLDWGDEQAQILDDFSTFVKDNNLLQPHIQRQQISVDIEGWLLKAVNDTPPVLKDINKSYNFGVERDEAGNVFLYNRQFANSAENRSNDPAIHSFPNQLTGKYTTRAVLYHAGDPGLHVDPYRMPPIAFDLAPLRKTVSMYHAHNAMSEKDRMNFTAMLDALQAGQAKQQVDCSTCYDLLVGYSKHGVVSQRKRATDAERQLANEKKGNRTKSWEAMQSHLRDSAFAAEHDATMVHSGFWTDWLTRVREHIQPAYIERGLLMNPAQLEQPYHVPETRLCSGVGEPPVHRDAAERIDLKYLHRLGVPAKGQWAIQRTDDSREPFQICEVRQVQMVQRGIRQSAEPQELAPLAAASSSGGAAAAAAAPAAFQHLPEWDVPDGKHLRMKDVVCEIIYHDICPDDFQRLHLSSNSDSRAKKQVDDQWWEAKFAEHAGSCRIPQHSTEEALNAAMTAAMQNRKAPPARPSWIVNLYRTARFLAVKREDAAWIPGGTLVAWGTLNDLFRPAAQSRGLTTFTLRAPIWRQVFEDLTETKMDAHSSVPVSSGRARKRGRSSSNVEDQSDENGNASGADEAHVDAAMDSRQAPARPRLHRTAHAVHRYAEASEEDGDSDSPSEDGGDAADCDPDDEPLAEIAKRAMMRSASEWEDDNLPLSCLNALKPAPPSNTPATSSRSARANARALQH